MKHTKGELEVFIGKYDAHILCVKGDENHFDILGDFESEQAFANLDEIARRWNCYDELLKQSDLLTLGLLQEKGRVARLEKELKELKANHNKHTGRMYEMANEARKQGRIEGLSEYAWWKDGVQYVGTCSTTLKQAIANAERS